MQLRRLTYNVTASRWLLWCYIINLFYKSAYSNAKAVLHSYRRVLIMRELGKWEKRDNPWDFTATNYRMKQPFLLHNNSVSLPCNCNNFIWNAIIVNYRSDAQNKVRRDFDESSVFICLIINVPNLSLASQCPSMRPHHFICMHNK